MGEVIEDIKFQDLPDLKSVPASNEEPNIIVLKFADSSVPVFREQRNKDYITYGENNYYPEYLTWLFNKSAKHNAIITGKANYIFGKGYANGDAIINRLNESLNDLAKKCLLDIEIYGGFRLEVIFNKNGRISEIYHADFACLRKGKDGGFYYKEKWFTDGKWQNENRKEPEQFITAFDPAHPTGNQIFEYNEYRPGVRYYPLPGYIGSNNYIETDIEISKYYLSAIRNGMMPSKMIQFYDGDPPDEKKRAIETRFTRKFAGTENAGKIILVFNKANAAKDVKVDDLSASELDKHFIEMNKTVQQEIFSGHLVTSPMLFGIMEPGKLGGATELNLAYSIFKNTYSEPKAAAYDKEINWLLSFSNFAGQYKLEPTDPIGIQFDVKDVVNSLPKQFVFESLGIPKEMWGLENIGADNKPTGTLPQPPSPDVTAPGLAAINDNIKNLTGRQYQGVMRIVRQYDYGNGKLNREAAVAMLKKGFGLDDEDIIAFLGEEPQPVALSFENQLDDVVAMFDACGDSKNDFEILKSKKVLFASDLEDDEIIFKQEAFKTYDVTASENKIIELIKKDPLITATVIAGVIKETTAFVESKIASLVKRGYIESEIKKIGEDEIISRIVPKGIDITIPPVKSKVNPTQIYIKYSYEVKPGIGPAIIPTTRPFCIKMVHLNRLYSRADIERISERLGYSVFDRKGGFWGHNPECRHRWVSHIVIKKGGSNES